MLFDLNDPSEVRINIRRRPAMYIGGTDVAGMTQLVWELVANSVDQFLAGHATGLRIQTDGNLPFSGSDVFQRKQVPLF